MPRLPLHDPVRGVRLRRACGAALLVLGLVCNETGVAAREPVAREYEVKAGFIYNFAKFVEWPSDCFAGAGNHFVIGVLAAPTLQAELEKAVRGRKINGRDVVVESYGSAADIATPQVLFVGRGERARELLERLGSRPVLTVGETDDFLLQGGTIAFVFEGDKLRFEIGAKAAAKARLKLSAQLQKLARAVRHKE